MASILKVNELQHTGGTSAMTVDSDGRVGFNNPIIFQGYNDTTTYTSTGTWVATKETIDTASAYNNSTGIFTAPKAGYYHCAFHALYRGPGNVRLSFRKNNSTYSGGAGGAASLLYQDAEASDEDNVNMTQIIQCAAADTIDVYITLAGGDIYGNSNGHNGMNIFYIG